VVEAALEAGRLRDVVEERRGLHEGDVDLLAAPAQRLAHLPGHAGDLGAVSADVLGHGVLDKEAPAG
jgi:hypothetical protein